MVCSGIETPGHWYFLLSVLSSQGEGKYGTGVFCPASETSYQPTRLLASPSSELLPCTSEEDKRAHASFTLVGFFCFPLEGLRILSRAYRTTAVTEVSLSSCSKNGWHPAITSRHAEPRDTGSKGELLY